MAELRVQEEELGKFSHSQASAVKAWKEEVERFEDDPYNNPNPFKLHKSGMIITFCLPTASPDISEGMSLHDIHAEIAKEEEVGGLETGEDPDGDERNMSTTEFLLQMLEAEDHQYVFSMILSYLSQALFRRQLKYEVSALRDPTPHKVAQLTETRNRLTRKIVHLRRLQAYHCTSALQALATHPSVLDPQSTSQPEDVPLMFPSDLPLVPHLSSIQHLEGRLRDGLCQDALDQLRNDLLVKTRLYTYKKTQARKQGANTRTRAKMDRQDKKIKLATLKYQRAWQAKLAIVGSDPIRVGWHQLRQEDVRPMREAEVEVNGTKGKGKGKRVRVRDEVSSEEDDVDDEGTQNNQARANSLNAGEGYRKLSWIWMAADNTVLPTNELLHAGEYLLLLIYFLSLIITSSSPC